MRWQAAIDRFWASVNKTEGCWLWTASAQKNGYGRFQDQEKKYVAHRWLHERMNGPVPKGKELCHHCDTPGCVRPDHLFVGTRADNMRDCAAKGRNAMQRRPWRSHFVGNRTIQKRGEEQGSSKLTADQVIAIKRLRKSGVPTSAIASQFDISPSHVRKLASGAAWRHIP